MRVFTKQEATGPAPDGDLEYFTGRVTHLKLWAPPGEHASNAAVVCFEEGVRGSWHTHGGGQFIHVVEGEGLIELRGEEPVRLQTGDSVALEAGEVHRHAAAPGHELAHLAISWGPLHWLDEDGGNA